MTNHSPEQSVSPSRASSEKPRPRAQVRGPEGLMHAYFFVRTIANYAEGDLELFQRYGDVVHLRSPNDILFFFRPSHIKHIFRTNVLNYPKSFQYDMLRPILGEGIFVRECDVATE